VQGGDFVVTRHDRALAHERLYEVAAEPIGNVNSNWEVL